MGGAALRKRGTEATDLPRAAAETGSTGELLCYVGQSVPSFFLSKFESSFCHLKPQESSDKQVELQASPCRK